ncbi:MULTISPECIES: lanthionine synthetase LanC family protein [Trichocoleus]|uniref:Lanthionine synthetase C-like protein n=1 Tax=Trichocoleus desertorum GB2-A4 TaxID=2933944 RepID=A0ABV0JGL9_9CYAN|nr:lanthionine synthetase LanC family protein [Trichocoleus sp. FACHB-46]
MVTALALLPQGVNESFDRLLAQGGELTWQAGPLKKGSNLCHGTGGNGYAFLKLFVRTGNQMWLDRARIFAMHAIAQYELAQQLYRQLRYPLWTGDLGLAVYLWDCLQAQAKFPTIDCF